MSKPLSLDLPAGIRRTAITIPGGHLAAFDSEGSPGDTVASTGSSALAPALLVPGFTGSKEDFLPSLGLLTAGGRRVIAIDQRGQYESAGPDDPSAYTVPALARDLLEVIDSIGGPVHLVGHSFGGLVARDAVIHRPDAAVSLTLLDSGPAALGGHRAFYLEVMSPILAEGGLPAVWAALTELQAADPVIQALPPDVHAFLERRFLTQSPTAVEVTGQALLDEPDRVDELRAAYDGPILVACGAEDDAWPPDVQESMAGRLGARFELVPDALHSPAAENPEATAALLDGFWAEVEASVGSR